MVQRETLAVKYRPKKWEDVVSQTTTVKILSSQIRSKSFKSAYLFIGPAGTGKTTLARIFAAEINNNNGIPIEIDAASNNGASDVRKLVDEAVLQSINSEYKIYIIDECHAFSTAAWQVFLKILEEPPARTIFIFCTTDFQKIPATILSRIQRFEFSKIPTDAICDRLKEILILENITETEEEGIKLIAKLANGGLRDGLTYLDKVLSYSDKISVETVLTAIGNVSYDILFDITDSILNKNTSALLKLINEIYFSGKDIRLFIDNYLQFILDLIAYRDTYKLDYITIPESYMPKLKQFASKNLLPILNTTLKLLNDIKFDNNPKNLVIASFILCSEAL